MSSLSDAILLLLEKKRKKKINPDYLTRDSKKMKSEIEKHAHKDDDDASAYTSHPKGQWKADYNKKGEKYKTKPSKWTEKLRRMEKSADEGEEGRAVQALGMLQEAAEEQMTLNEALGKSVMKSLRKKADLTNSPLGALTTVYRKGLAAWKTGHRPGVTQHQWAMGRVNSFLGGGKARKVDAAQWERVRQYRKRHKRTD
jgi:hypothetical protein